jgi:hypothetical protein
MKVVIAGSRDITDYDVLLKAIKECPFQITEVISGRARGVDTLGEKYAEDCGLKLHLFPADWKKYRNAAGPIRTLKWRILQMLFFVSGMIKVLELKT